MGVVTWGWFKYYHMMEVSWGSVGGSSGGHPSYRVGQCHKKISDGERMGMSARSSHWHDFRIYY